MNVSFLFPGGSRYDALDNWVRTIGRYSGQFKVTLARSPADCKGADVVFLLTECFGYPQAKIDGDMVSLRGAGIPFGVVHNNDNPGFYYEDRRALPTPGDYPSFCWTEQALRRLGLYRPTLLRQPVLPPLMAAKQRPLHVGTFGHVEPKKATLEMAHWAALRGIPFTAFCPDVSEDWCPDRKKLHVSYCNEVRAEGGRVVIYPWAEKVEDLAPFFEDVSHFLFVLPPSKGGSGGSPTSPRYATAFARPVMVLDDEATLGNDGIYVFESLNDIATNGVLGGQAMAPPNTSWHPEKYVSELVRLTLAWRKP